MVQPRLDGLISRDRRFQMCKEVSMTHNQVDDEDDVYIVEQIDAARQRRDHWEYRVIWEGYPDP
eukprot:4312441-Pleurochrysis_carterae.AAC.1